MDQLWDGYVQPLCEKKNRGTITISYRILYLEAVKLANQIESEYPTLKVIVKPAGFYAIKKFGPHVGVCYLNTG